MFTFEVGAWVDALRAHSRRAEACGCYTCVLIGVGYDGAWCRRVLVFIREHVRAHSRTLHRVPESTRTAGLVGVGEGNLFVLIREQGISLRT